jgi:hypothetical protein
VAPRLKVFVTSDGLTDYVVAASSRPKALAAWGVRQDLFKEGQAHETDDPALAEAALARPGEVLRRPAGSRAALARVKVARPARPAGPSRAALKKVEALERRLQALEERLSQALAHFDRERTALHAREARERERADAERAKLESELARARAALRT